MEVWSLERMTVSRAMTHDFPFDEINDIFRDIGGMIGDTFEVFRYGTDFGRAADGLSILYHKGECLAEDLRIELIDFVIVSTNLEC